MLKKLSYKQKLVTFIYMESSKNKHVQTTISFEIFSKTNSSFNQ